MRILAADTTTSVNTVAVCDGDRVLAETFVDCGRSHTERLMATVDWVLGEAGLTLEEVEALAISVGPGSFTGLRVGVAAWKGLALARNLPLAAVPTLDAMTRLSGFRDAVVCPLLDAKMGEVFGAIYRFDGGKRTKLTEDRVGPVEAVLDGIEPRAWFLGDGAALYQGRIMARCTQAMFLPGLCARPRASAVAAEGIALLDGGACADAALVSPRYLRKSQPEEARRSDAGRGENAVP